jgi:hypothetical protein
VTPGTRLDALRFALGANAVHGKRRDPGDYRSAYARACDNGLVGPTDVAAVQAVLHCTKQWAYRLTEAARAEADAKRDADIAARKAAGQSNRAIARAVGLSHQTVARATSGPKTNSLEVDHPADPPSVLTDLPPRPMHPAQIEFNHMTSPSGLRWGDGRSETVSLFPVDAINTLESPYARENTKSRTARRVGIDTGKRPDPQKEAREEQQRAYRHGPLVRRLGAAMGPQDLAMWHKALRGTRQDRSTISRLLAAEIQPVLV